MVSRMMYAFLYLDNTTLIFIFLLKKIALLLLLLLLFAQVKEKRTILNVFVKERTPWQNNNELGYLYN